MRVGIGAEAVFLPDVVCQLCPPATQIAYQGGVAVASINKYVLLYLVVTLVGVLVQFAQSVLCLGVKIDVASQRVGIVFQFATYALRYQQARVAILGPVFCHYSCRYALQMVYQAVLENLASEQAARMVAMKAATDNAETLVSDLQLEYNKARQAGITMELNDIVSGASAV